MRRLTLAGVLGMMLTAAPVFAQAPAPAPAPAAPAPAPQAPAQAAPAQPAPAQPAPAQPAAAAPAPAAPLPVVAPFPVGTKYAFVNIQRLTAETAEGKAAFTRLQALNTQKVNELNGLNKELQGLQQKLDAGANVLSVNAVADLQKQIERKTVDIQRATEDAQQDMTNLQTQLQGEFEQRIGPILTAVAQEKGLHMLFSVQDAGLVWWDPSLDVTPEVIAKADAAPQRPAAAAPAAAPRPAAAPPAARPAAPPAQPRPAAPAAPAPTRP